MCVLPGNVRDRIIEVLTQEPSVKTAILFGSRARGYARANSDIDLALIGSNIPLSLHTRLREAAGLYRIDIVRWDEVDNDELRANITNDGVVLYSHEEASTIDIG
jgi:predicted nucleotidyltransferase